MSPQPPGGHGRLCSISQMPDRSGFPSAVRGAGALRSGLPSAARGTPAVGYFSHWAERVADRDAAHAIARMPVTLFIVTSGNGSARETQLIGAFARSGQ